MKIATWNVNSVRARMAHLLDWLERSSPDIVGLQETKVVDADFPIEPINELGYQVVYTGQKSYNGVAILSLKPARDVCVQLEGAEDYGARFIAATFDDSKGESFRFINAYVINGREVGAPAYDDKLNFLARLQAHVQQAVSAGNEVAVVGDFNIAPADADVYDPEEWRDKILCSVPERTAMQNLLSQVGPTRHPTRTPPRRGTTHLVGLPRSSLPTPPRHKNRPHPTKPSPAHPLHQLLSRRIPPPTIKALRPHTSNSGILKPGYRQ